MSVIEILGREMEKDKIFKAGELRSSSSMIVSAKCVHGLASPASSFDMIPKELITTSVDYSLKIYTFLQFIEFKTKSNKIVVSNKEIKGWCGKASDKRIRKNLKKLEDIGLIRTVIKKMQIHSLTTTVRTVFLRVNPSRRRDVKIS